MMDYLGGVGVEVEQMVTGVNESACAEYAFIESEQTKASQYTKGVIAIYPHVFNPHFLFQTSGIVDEV